MASQDHRVEKLEDALLARLTPVNRLCEALKAAADGNEDLLLRILDTCPRKTYKMADAAYVDRVYNAVAVFMRAEETFSKYVFACRVIEDYEMDMKQIADFIPTIRTQAGDVADWTPIDEAQEEGAIIALTAVTTVLKDRMDERRGSLHDLIRAEWAGFDAFCKSELHLDAWTFLKAFGVEAKLTAWVQDILSEPRPERQPEDDKFLTGLVVETEANWRTSFLAGRGKKEIASAT